MVFSPALMAQLRRVDIRTRLRESTPSGIDILCVRAPTEPRDLLTAQELLLRGTSADGRVG